MCVQHIVLIPDLVVPHAGTWIEITGVVGGDVTAVSSFPTRERGLKYLTHMYIHGMKVSFPTRERGLKCRDYVYLWDMYLSFPTRERGLKF